MVPGSLKGNYVQIVAKWSNEKLKIKEEKVKTDESSNILLLKGQKIELRDGSAIAFFLANSQLRRDGDAYAMSQVIQWMSYAENHITPQVLALTLSKLGLDAKISSSSLKNSEDQLSQTLKAVNEILLKKTYFIDERISLADLTVFSALLPLYEHVLSPESRKMYGNLTRWFETILHQPAVLDVVKNFRYSDEKDHNKPSPTPQPKRKGNRNSNRKKKSPPC